MSIQERFEFLLSILTELTEHYEIPKSIISLVLSESDSAFPELFEIINTHDGNLIVQHLSSEGHKILFREITTKENIRFLMSKIDTVRSMRLIWGPEYLIEYTF